MVVDFRLGFHRMMMDGFVLKRVGKCSGSTHATVSLESFVTRIGRHTMNDCCMDSVDLPCLVSRFHSAIIREETDGVIKYFVYDCKSLNGTFVNNVKIPAEKNILLKEGDILTFGCRGGDAIKEGGRATEEYSEFQYMFIRKSEAHDVNSSSFLSVKTNHKALPKARPNGVIDWEKPVVQPRLAAALSKDASSHLLVKDHVGSTNDVTQPSLVQTHSLKNTLNNSTGHLVMPSEQRTPIVGSRKRKVTSNSSTKAAAMSSENGTATKQQKISENKGQPKTKTQQKLKRKTRKNLTYSDDELCSAFDCKRPNSETVSWVQCDDCDEWFHVDCVPNQGQYDMEQLEEEEFHCGCV